MDDDQKLEDNARLSTEVQRAINDYIGCYGRELEFDTEEDADAFFERQRFDSLLALAFMVGRGIVGEAELIGNRFLPDTDAAEESVRNMIQVGMEAARPHQFRGTTQVRYYTTNPSGLGSEEDPPNVIRPSAWDDGGED